MSTFNFMLYKGVLTFILVDEIPKSAVNYAVQDGQLLSLGEILKKTEFSEDLAFLQFLCSSLNDFDFLLCDN